MKLIFKIFLYGSTRTIKELLKCHGSVLRTFFLSDLK